MTTTDKPKGRVGRPRKADSARPRGGKGAVMTARITGEMRDALEAEAERTGRTIGQVAEIWMEEARRGRVQGGPAITSTLQRLADFQDVICREVGDPLADSMAREALVAGWTLLVQRSLPGTPVSKAELELARLHMATVDSALDLAEAIARMGERAPDDATFQRVMRRATNNVLASFAADYDPADDSSFHEMLVEFARTNTLTKVAARVSARLHGYLAERGDEPSLIPLGHELRGPAEALMSSLTREVEAWSALSGARVEARRRGQVLVAAIDNQHGASSPAARRDLFVTFQGAGSSSGG